MTEWDELIEPEFVEEVVTFEEAEGEPLETELDYESASGGNLTQKRDAEETIEGEVNEFIAGGCMPEEDGEIKCKFNLGGYIAEIGRAGEYKEKVSFKEPVLSVEDADQTRATNSDTKGKNSTLLMISGEDYTFCTVGENDKFKCKKFKLPEGKLTLKKLTDEGGVISGKNEKLEIKPEEVTEAEKIKFPLGGNVLADQKKELVSVEVGEWE